MASPYAIAKTLGHRFSEEALLLEALTPPSAGLPINNQRLEYLGDALLHACVGFLIFRERPDWGEGWMSKLRGVLVGVESLKAWSADLGLELRQGPRSPKKPAPEGAGKPMADAVEALLAAVHEDVRASGGNGYDAVLALVEARFLKTIRQATPSLWESKDSKTTLQERAAQLRLPNPVYRTLRQTGPEHQPLFTVEVQVGEARAEASAHSVKRAQAEAAGALLKNLG